MPYRQILQDRVVVGSGIVATGATSVPTDTYGSYLVSNGFWALSYAEWCQVLAAVWVTILIGAKITEGVKWLIGKFK